MKEIKVAVLSLVVLSLFLLVGPIHAADNVGINKIDKALLGKKGPVEVFILTTEKTVVDYTGQVETRSPAIAKMFEASIDVFNNNVFSRCKTVSSTIEKGWMFNTVLSGFSAKVEAADLQRIARLPSVRRIADASYRYQLHINKHLPYINVTQLRAMGGPGGRKLNGSGIRVGIVDTGVNYMHHALGGGRGKRVKFGYDFGAGDDDPMDEEGHGSHVAGIVGANGLLFGDPVTGTAPEVTFGAYKVANESEAGLRPTNVAAGIEMAVKDKCSIVNMSLGRALYYGGEDVLESEAIKKAAEAGTLCVISAGNDGYANDRLPLPIGVPSTAPEALSVAATDERKAIIEVQTSKGTKKVFCNNHIWGVPGISPDVSDVKIIDCGLIGTKPVNCVNNLALIELPGTARVWHRQDAFRAISALDQYNSRGFIFWKQDYEGIPFILTYFNSFEHLVKYKVPIFTVSGRDGAVLKEAAASGTNVKAARLSFPGDFSSVGPYLGERGFKFKPEISAPGMWITSTIANKDNLADSWDIYSGTSMASPFITGVAALLKQYHPNWQWWQLKSAMMNTAKIMYNPINEQPVPLIIQGSGLVNALAAATTQAIADPPAFTFHGGNYKEEITINLLNTDVTRKAVKIAARAEVFGDSPGISVSATVSDASLMPPKVDKPNEFTGSISVKVTIDKEAIIKNRVIDGAVFIVVDDAKMIHVPFMALFGNPSIYNSQKSYGQMVVEKDTIDIAKGEKPGKVKFHIGIGSKTLIWGNQYDDFTYMVRISAVDAIMDRWRDVYEGNFLIPGDYEFDWDGNDISGQSFMPTGPQGMAGFVYYDSIAGRELNKLVETSAPADPNFIVTVINSTNKPLPRLWMRADPDTGAVGSPATIKFDCTDLDEVKVVRFFLLYDPNRVAFEGVKRRGKLAEDEASIMFTVEDSGDGRMIVEILPVYEGVTLNGSGPLCEIDFACKRPGGVEFDTSFVEILNKDVKPMRFVRALSAELYIVDKFALVGDFNFDGVVDDKDMVIFAKAYLSKKGDENFIKACDINRDDIVDYKDFMYFGKNFGKTNGS